MYFGRNTPKMMFWPVEEAAQIVDVPAFAKEKMEGKERQKKCFNIYNQLIINNNTHNNYN